MTMPLKRSGMLSLLSCVISKAASCCVLGTRTQVEPGHSQALAAAPRLVTRPCRPTTRYSFGFALTKRIGASSEGVRRGAAAGGITKVAHDSGAGGKFAPEWQQRRDRSEHELRGCRRNTNFALPVASGLVENGVAVVACGYVGRNRPHACPAQVESGAAGCARSSGSVRSPRRERRRSGPSASSVGKLRFLPGKRELSPPRSGGPGSTPSEHDWADAAVVVGHCPRRLPFHLTPPIGAGSSAVWPD
jgi:hypothetical protein